jgi:2-keto-4-pentenoate hydratase/2-oxohepta-3-ene-1,7-dioic acid hydratase in catechol pathway
MTSWIRFRPPGGASTCGTLRGNEVAEFRGELFAGPQATGRTFELGEVRLESPCVPTKVIALWNNFHALSEKIGKAAPTHPLFLIKPANSVTGPATTIRRPPRYEGKVVYEGELGIVIGKRCSQIGADEARAYIFGYTCVNDVTAGQLIDESPDFAQWTRAKCADTFCCLGPAIATDFDWRAGRVVTTLDGIERQNYPLADMIIPPHEIVAALSADLTLDAGDVIACGTSLGVGAMKDGARVCVHIEGIGELHNRFAAPF